MKFLRSQVILFAVLTTANLIPRIVGSDSESTTAGKVDYVQTETTTHTEEPVTTATSTSPPPTPLPTSPVNIGDSENNIASKNKTVSESNQSLPPLIELTPIQLIEEVQLADAEPYSSGISNPQIYSLSNGEDHNSQGFGFVGTQQILTLVPIPQLSAVDIEVDSERGPEKVQAVPVAAFEFPEPVPEVIGSLEEQEQQHGNEDSNENANADSEEDGKLGEDLFGSAVEIVDRDDEHENAIVALSENKASRALQGTGFGKFRTPSAKIGGFRQAPVSLYLVARPQTPSYGNYGYNSRPQWGYNNYNYNYNGNGYAGNRYSYGNGYGYARPAPYNNYYGSGWNSQYAGYNRYHYNNRPSKYNRNRRSEYHNSLISQYHHQPSVASIAALGKK